MHNISCHQVGVWQFNPGVRHLQLGCAILIHELIALFIYESLHMAEALHEHMQPALNAAHHY